MRLVSTFSQVGSVPTFVKESVGDKQMDLPTHCGSDVANTMPIVSWFSCMGLCTRTELTYPEFQFTTTVFMSVTTRSSDLDNQKPGINIQTEGHTLTPLSGWNGPEDQEAFGSTPSHSPSQSLARKPTPDWPETQYCLEIQVTSTDDEGVTPPTLMCGRHQSWKTWFKMANLAWQKP